MKTYLELRERQVAEGLFVEDVLEMLKGESKLEHGKVEVGALVEHLDHRSRSGKTGQCRRAERAVTNHYEI